MEQSAGMAPALRASAETMFTYPRQAEVNRPVPKNKIYGYAKPSRAIRDRFVPQVSEIVWQYKLAPETVNLPAKMSVHGIQVFKVFSRTHMALLAPRRTGGAVVLPRATCGFSFFLTSSASSF